jgi:hypothetical protein
MGPFATLRRQVRPSEVRSYLTMQMPPEFHQSADFKMSEACSFYRLRVKSRSTIRPQNAAAPLGQ